MDSDLSKMVCRVCGLFQGDPPWGEEGIDPSHNICTCCGTEFGYEDCSINATCKNREEWLKNGAPWWNPKFMPENWSLEDQLKQIPKEFL